jgi:hypothetical protein
MLGIGAAPALGTARNQVRDCHGYVAQAYNGLDTVRVTTVRGIRCAVALALTEGKVVDLTRSERRFRLGAYTCTETSSMFDVALARCVRGATAFRIVYGG